MKNQIRNFLLIAIVPMLLCSCQSEEPATQIFKPDFKLYAARRLYTDEFPTDSKPRVNAVIPATLPSQPRLLSTTKPIRAVPTTGPSAIASAKTSSTAQPNSAEFLQATEYYDYQSGMVYTAITSPGFITTIALAQGEKLLTAAAGDTSRWVVQTVESGSGATAQTLLLIKPRKAGLATNLVVTTDQRIYTLDLMSQEEPTYHTMIAWHYATSEMVLVRNALPEKPVSPVSANPKPDLTQMNFGYQIRTQKQPPKWTPLRAFDDGIKTYIQLPPNISINPPLFAQGEHGSTELVNYRVKGDWYIVDRLLDKAELRMGTYPQTVVIIERVTGKN